MMKRSHLRFLFAAAAVVAAVLWIAHPLAHFDNPGEAAYCPLCMIAKAAHASPSVPAESLVPAPSQVRTNLAARDFIVCTAAFTTPRQPRAPPALSVSL